MTPDPTAPPGSVRYLRRLTLVAMSMFFATWVYVAWFPAAVLGERGYPVWHAKIEMLRHCDLGTMVVLGDSRVAIGVIPALLPEATTNLAFPAAGPIESYYAARAVVRCPTLPRRAVLSITMHELTGIDAFWERSVRFGFLTGSEVRAIETTADRLGDASLRNASNLNGLPYPVRSWLYQARFPAAYFASLMNGGLMGYRYFLNRSAEATVVAARGYLASPADFGGGVIGPEAAMARFVPSPLASDYLCQTIAVLTAHGVAVDFVATPVSISTFARTQAAVVHDFAAYLEELERRYPGFHVIGPVLPHWPDRYFSEVWQHLTRPGAVLFSRWLAQCLHGVDCDEAALDRWTDQYQTISRNGQAVPEGPPLH